MFDIALSEMMLIAAVALMILGPERLPAVARTIGVLIARLQRAIASLKADIQQDNHVISDVETFRRDLQNTALDMQRRLDAEMQCVQQTDTVIEQAAVKTMSNKTSDIGELR